MGKCLTRYSLLMENTTQKYVTVAYELYIDNEKGIHELAEKAPVEHPFQFISGMGVTLPAFEENIVGLQAGDKFDFVLKKDDAYGEYVQKHVIDLPKSTFYVNGKFDKDMVYPGAVLPLVNEDGNRFNGLVLKVTDEVVTVDLNHPFAGKDLHFKGEVVTLREATNAEIEEMAKLMSGEGCGCCGGEGDCEGGCHHGDDGCHHGEGGCCHKH